MAINFRKRKKVLPGVYLNFSKKGISTTIGPRGANINFAKNGAFFNTGIPGTGLYSRQKISGNRNNGTSSQTSRNNFPPIPSNNVKSEKSKTTAILLALFFGTWGIHRFYLGQYWRGIFSVLFCWTYIPTFISLLDVIIFAAMSKDKFDDKYNNLLFSEIKSFANDNSGKYAPTFSSSIPTSQSLEELKKHIEEARQERQGLESEIRKQQSITKKLENTLKSKESSFGKIFANKESVEKLRNEVKEASEYLIDLCSQYAESQANINIQSDKETQEQYLKLKNAYIELSHSNKIWDVVSERSTTENKSAAKTSIDRKEVVFTLEDIDFILSEHSAFHLENADGDNLFIFPAFILQINKENVLTLIDLQELHFRFHKQRFLEEKTTIPIDTQIVDYTWHKVNKDGSPDKRFVGNFQIPVVEYGAFEFGTNSGLREIYYISNVQLAENFANEFRRYLSLISPEGQEPINYTPSPGVYNRIVDFNNLDPLTIDAARIIVSVQQASTSLIQRTLKIGYDRAGKIIDELEAIGIIGPFNGAKARDTLVLDLDNLESIFEQKTFINNNLSSKKSDFSYPYYSLLKHFSKSLHQIVFKLQSNDAVLKQINNGQIQTPARDFIATCVIFDMVQISKILAKGTLSTKSLEATGMVLATNGLLPNSREDFMDKDFETLATAHQKGIYSEVVKQLLELGAVENPMEITIQEKEGEKVISSTKRKNNLSFPTFLKISDNPLFEEYATILYRYANIISKADNIVSKEEENILKEIYQITHNPIPEKKNEALVISKGENNETLDEVLFELNSLIGLSNVKEEINTLINFIKIQKAREQSGLKSSSLSYHIVFTGNPGTGKTTVARIVAKIYKHLGILTEGQLVETDRSGLVAEYVGQTAVKVNKTVNSALNGVLFIDEAYSIVGENKDDFGKEAVSTLIKRMEDDRDKLVLVLAGYTNEMKSFIDTNPGFKSRFNRYITFPDYTPSELLEIFESKCHKLEYDLTDDAKSKLRSIFENEYSLRDQTFGNARLVRNLFEKTLEQQANRIAKQSSLTKEILTTITVDDIAK